MSHGNTFRDPASGPVGVVKWVTNLAAPYRLPVWHALSQSFRLSLVLLESERARSNDGRRGGDWAGATLAVDAIHPRVVRLARGERVYYVLLDPWRFWPDRYGVVVLGGWESPAYWQMLLMARIKRVPCIGFYESTLATNRHRAGIVAFARRWFFRSLDAVVVPGVASERAIVSLGISAEKVYRGFNAVDVASFQRQAAEARRSTVVRPLVGHRYVYVGQYIARKNLFRMIRAFVDQASADDSMTLIGGGELSQELRDFAAQFDASIEFRDPVANHDLPSALAYFDTLVLVSEQEVWGLVVNEALAAGLHVVVSEDAGVSASIEGMRGAYLVSPTVNDIARGLAESRREWRGPIENPEILKYGPTEFANVFARAIQAVGGRFNG